MKESTLSKENTLSRSTQPVEQVRTLRGRPLSQVLHRVLVYALLIVGSVVFILPFMWMLTTSLKLSSQVFTFPPQFLPTTFEWRNYIDGWTALPFTRFLTNTVIVTGAAVLGNLVSCALPAYAFAHLRARSREFLFVLMLATIMIPAQVSLDPMFIVFRKVQRVNTLWQMYLPAWFGYSFSIYLLRHFFMDIPRSLIEAAQLEGASHLRILVSIILPLSKPALATVAIFAFVGNWNNLLGPLIYLRSTDKFTLPLGLNLFNGQYVTAYNQLMAVSILTILPIVVTFFLAQKYFVQGVVLGQGEK